MSHEVAQRQRTGRRALARLKLSSTMEKLRGVSEHGRECSEQGGFREAWRTSATTRRVRYVEIKPQEACISGEWDMLGAVEANLDRENIVDDGEIDRIYHGPLA